MFEVTSVLGHSQPTTQSLDWISLSSSSFGATLSLIATIAGGYVVLSVPSSSTQLALIPCRPDHSYTCVVFEPSGSTDQCYLFTGDSGPDACMVQYVVKMTAVSAISVSRVSSLSISDATKALPSAPLSASPDYLPTQPRAFTALARPQSIHGACASISAVSTGAAHTVTLVAATTCLKGSAALVTILTHDAAFVCLTSTSTSTSSPSTQPATTAAPALTLLLALPKALVAATWLRRTLVPLTPTSASSVTTAPTSTFTDAAASPPVLLLASASAVWAVCFTTTTTTAGADVIVSDAGASAGSTSAAGATGAGIAALLAKFGSSATAPKDVVKAAFPSASPSSSSTSALPQLTAATALAALLYSHPTTHTPAPAPKPASAGATVAPPPTAPIVALAAFAQPHASAPSASSLASPLFSSSTSAASALASLSLLLLLSSGELAVPKRDPASTQLNAPPSFISGIWVNCKVGKTPNFRIFPNHPYAAVTGSAGKLRLFHGLSLVHMLSITAAEPVPENVLTPEKIDDSDFLDVVQRDIPSALSACAVSPCGCCVAAVDYQGHMRTWRLVPTAKPIAITCAALTASGVGCAMQGVPALPAPLLPLAPTPAAALLLDRPASLSLLWAAALPHPLLHGLMVPLPGAAPMTDSSYPSAGAGVGVLNTEVAGAVSALLTCHESGVVTLWAASNTSSAATAPIAVQPAAPHTPLSSAASSLFTASAPTAWVPRAALRLPGGARSCVLLRGHPDAADTGAGAPPPPLVDRLLLAVGAGDGRVHLVRVLFAHALAGPAACSLSLLASVWAHEGPVRALAWAEHPSATATAAANDSDAEAEAERVCSRLTAGDCPVHPGDIHTFGIPDASLPENDISRCSCVFVRGYLATGGADGLVHVLHGSAALGPPVGTVAAHADAIADLHWRVLPAAPASTSSTTSAVSGVSSVFAAHAPSPTAWSLYLLSSSSAAPSLLLTPLPPARARTPLLSPISLAHAPVLASALHPSHRFVAAALANGCVAVYPTTHAHAHVQSAAADASSLPAPVRVYRQYARPQQSTQSVVQYVTPSVAHCPEDALAVPVAVSVDPSGSLLTVALATGAVRVLDWISGKVLSEQWFSCAATRILFTDDCEHCIVCLSDGTALHMRLRSQEDPHNPKSDAISTKSITPAGLRAQRNTIARRGVLHQLLAREASVHRHAHTYTQAAVTATATTTAGVGVGVNEAATTFAEPVREKLLREWGWGEAAHAPAVVPTLPPALRALALLLGDNAEGSGDAKATDKPSSAPEGGIAGVGAGAEQKSAWQDAEEVNVDVDVDVEVEGSAGGAAQPLATYMTLSPGGSSPRYKCVSGYGFGVEDALEVSVGSEQVDLAALTLDLDGTMAWGSPEKLVSGNYGSKIPENVVAEKATASKWGKPVLPLAVAAAGASLPVAPVAPVAPLSAGVGARATQRLLSQRLRRTSTGASSCAHTLTQTLPLSYAAADASYAVAAEGKGAQGRGVSVQRCFSAAFRTASQRAKLDASARAGAPCDGAAGPNQGVDGVGAGTGMCAALELPTVPGSMFGSGSSLYDSHSYSLSYSATSDGDRAADGAADVGGVGVGACVLEQSVDIEYLADFEEEEALNAQPAPKSSYKASAGTDLGVDADDDDDYSIDDDIDDVIMHDTDTPTLNTHVSAGVSAGPIAATSAPVLVDVHSPALPATPASAAQAAATAAARARIAVSVPMRSPSPVCVHARAVRAAEATVDVDIDLSPRPRSNTGVPPGASGGGSGVGGMGVGVPGTGAMSVVVTEEGEDDEDILRLHFTPTHRHQDTHAHTHDGDSYSTNEPGTPRRGNAGSRGRFARASAWQAPAPPSRSAQSSTTQPQAANPAAGPAHAHAAPWSAPEDAWLTAAFDGDGGTIRYDAAVLARVRAQVQQGLGRAASSDTEPEPVCAATPRAELEGTAVCSSQEKAEAKAHEDAAEDDEEENVPVTVRMDASSFGLLIGDPHSDGYGCGSGLDSPTHAAHVPSPQHSRAHVAASLAQAQPASAPATGPHAHAHAGSSSTYTPDTSADTAARARIVTAAAVEVEAEADEVALEDTLPLAGTLSRGGVGVEMAALAAAPRVGVASPGTGTPSPATMSTSPPLSAASPASHTHAHACPYAYPYFSSSGELDLSQSLRVADAKGVVRHVFSPTHAQAHLRTTSSAHSSPVQRLVQIATDPATSAGAGAGARVGAQHVPRLALPVHPADAWPARPGEKAVEAPGTGRSSYSHTASSHTARAVEQALHVLPVSLALPADAHPPIPADAVDEVPLASAIALLERSTAIALVALQSARQRSARAPASAAEQAEVLACTARMHDLAAQLVAPARAGDALHSSPSTREAANVTGAEGRVSASAAQAPSLPLVPSLSSARLLLSSGGELEVDALAASIAAQVAAALRSQ